MTLLDVSLIFKLAATLATATRPYKNYPEGKITETHSVRADIIPWQTFAPFSRERIGLCAALFVRA